MLKHITNIKVQRLLLRFLAGALTLLFTFYICVDFSPFNVSPQLEAFKSSANKRRCFDDSMKFMKYESLVYKRRRRQWRTGEWTLWTPWTDCENHSDLRTFAQTRERICNGGEGCVDGESTQARACLPNNPSSTDTNTAQWRSWSEWSDCNVDPSAQFVSGSAFRTRWRECDRANCIHCAPCVGETYEQVLCSDNDLNTSYRDINRPSIFVYPRQGENCQWSQWSAWSPCSAMCGRNAMSYRARTCSCTVRHGCAGPPVEDKLCDGLPPCNDLNTIQNPQPWTFYDPAIPSSQPASFAQLSNENKNAKLGYPCNMCPPHYPFPCYMCINLKNPRYGSVT